MQLTRLEGCLLLAGAAWIQTLIELVQLTRLKGLFGCVVLPALVAAVEGGGFYRVLG